jgi:hypothetical protein
MRETLKDGAKTGAQTRLSFRESAKDGALLWPDDAPKDAPPLAESLPQGEFTVPRESFFRVNTETAGLLLKDFSDIVAKLKPELLLDLYCGVGVFGIAGAKAGAAHVEACEIDAKAVACACANAKAAGLDNCRFHAGDAAKLISKLGSKAVGNSLLVLDPPRSGLSEKALKGAVDAGAGHIVYASCAADSLCATSRTSRRRLRRRVAAPLRHVPGNGPFRDAGPPFADQDMKLHARAARRALDFPSRRTRISNQLSRGGKPMHGEDRDLLKGHRDRLRAKYLAAGAEGMLDYERLELLLTYAIARRDVKPVAKRLLARFKTLSGSSTPSSANFAKSKGWRRTRPSC